MITLTFTQITIIICHIHRHDDPMGGNSSMKCPDVSVGILKKTTHFEGHPDLSFIDDMHNPLPFVHLV